MQQQERRSEKKNEAQQQHDVSTFVMFVLMMGSVSMIAVTFFLLLHIFLP
jgi:hypothetical protein